MKYVTPKWLKYLLYLVKVTLLSLCCARRLIQHDQLLLLVRDKEDSIGVANQQHATDTILDLEEAFVTVVWPPTAERGANRLKMTCPGHMQVGPLQDLVVVRSG